ncbi:MAG TPA: phosphatase [Actinomycetota bacterium]
MSSDVIEAHVRRLPAPDPALWTPRPQPRAEIERGLLVGMVAGWATHPLDNVRGNAQMLLDHDPDKEFGLTGLQDGMSLERVLALVETAAGASLDREARTGPVDIRPGPIVDASLAAGARLAAACEGGERVVLATGHPTGLAHLYRALAAWLGANGAQVITPGVGARWREARLDHDWIVEASAGVVALTDGTEPRHTHWPYAMHRVLEADRPDLVVADHGFAGAAIEAGVETISIADVNDPALLVARAQGRTEHVLVMDDHVSPQDYWPVFLALTAPAAGHAPA